ncbi:hypothetical protein WICPIJ_004175 [Wickerhamomyces pijperi]|uniref:Micro-fibrillar-associated protein 1 C-terminal domain-containing protein n=1 Tax=Wickerhamomyces pijperi TaxID=599730 RepID=A0A9P8Q858_WICPI|nr:hypothetical protein WICPIJ_004175 [Wickerhamomyces pijperi]
MSFLNSRQHKGSGGDSRSNNTEKNLTSEQAKDSNAYSEKKPNSNSDSEEDEDSNSDSPDDSSSDSGSGSDSDSSLKLAPVFISKAKRMSNQKPKASETNANTKSDSDRKDQALKQIELSIKQDIAILKQQSEDTLGFEGIDDTDGLDPEAERKAWEIREEFRQKRDEEKLLKEQEEFEELQARRM